MFNKLAGIPPHYRNALIESMVGAGVGGAGGYGAGRAIDEDSGAPMSLLGAMLGGVGGPAVGAQLRRMSGPRVAERIRAAGGDLQHRAHGLDQEMDAIRRELGVVGKPSGGEEMLYASDLRQALKELHPEQEGLSEAGGYIARRSPGRKGVSPSEAWPQVASGPFGTGVQSTADAYVARATAHGNQFRDFYRHRAAGKSTEEARRLVGWKD